MVLLTANTAVLGWHLNYNCFLLSLKIPSILSVDSFDVRGMDVGSMVHVSLRLDNAGSFDWPWCADWVRTVIVYYLCGNSGEKFPLFSPRKQDWD